MPHTTRPPRHRTLHATRRGLALVAACLLLIAARREPRPCQLIRRTPHATGLPPHCSPDARRAAGCLRAATG